MPLKKSPKSKCSIKLLSCLFALLLMFVLCNNLSASVFIEGRVFAGGQYSLRGGMYDDTALYSENFKRYGGVIGIGIGIYNFTDNICERLGIIVEVMSHYYVKEDYLDATCTVWGLTLYYQYDFIKPKKGKLSPFIIAGPSLLYYSIAIKSDNYNLDVKDRHYKIAVMAGAGLNYFFTDKFSFEFMVRLFYIPADKNMLSAVATIGFRTIF